MRAVRGGCACAPRGGGYGEGAEVVSRIKSASVSLSAGVLASEIVSLSSRGFPCPRKNTHAPLARIPRALVRVFSGRHSFSLAFSLFSLAFSVFSLAFSLFSLAFSLFSLAFSLFRASTNGRIATLAFSAPFPFPCPVIFSGNVAHHASPRTTHPATHLCMEASDILCGLADVGVAWSWLLLACLLD